MNVLSPAEFVESYAVVGEKKSKAPIWRLFLLGILAGLFIGLGGVTANTAAHSMTNVGMARMVSGLLFPAGLIMVILTGAELFTGNCLIPISVFEGRATFGGMAKNWVAVYIGNFVGSVLLAAGTAYFGQMNYSAGGLATFTIKVAAAKCALPFVNALALGIFCNILVCAAVMMAVSGKALIGKAIGAYVPVAVFVICGFEHCIANMFFVPAGLFAMTVPKYAALAAEAGLDTTLLTWGNFLLKNLLPVTLGNIIGGVGFAAAIWSAYRKNAKAAA
mgnify:CR=1 FL=1